MMDQEFHKIEDKTDMVEINTTAARKHIGKTECYIRTIKEQSQALVSDLPFEVLPCQVIIHLLYFAVLWLNSLPAAAGVSEQYSPHKLSLVANLILPKTALPPLAPTSKPMSTPQLQIPCKFARSRESSLTQPAIAKALTKFLILTPALSKNHAWSHPYPCPTGSFPLSMTGDDVTQRRINLVPTYSSITNGNCTIGTMMISTTMKASPNPTPIPALASPLNSRVLTWSWSNLATIMLLRSLRPAKQTH
jgi:hypothetical protein